MKLEYCFRLFQTVLFREGDVQYKTILISSSDSEMCEAIFVNCRSLKEASVCKETRLFQVYGVKLNSVGLLQTVIFYVLEFCWPFISSAEPKSLASYSGGIVSTGSVWVSVCSIFLSGLWTLWSDRFIIVLVLAAIIRSLSWSTWLWVDTLQINRKQPC